MSVLPFFSCSKCVRARMVSLPRPVSYARAISSDSSRKPPVGKSGAGISFISSGSGMRGFSSTATTASMASPGLCGGMFVARPTAMPDAPLISRFGKRPGSSSGSLSVSSKLNTNGTVSRSMSRSSCSAAPVMRASV